MNQVNYLKILWIVLFLAFATVSCWATAESLHMLLASWPAFMCWIVSIGFFFIASLGTKMIADSLNSNIYMNKRGSVLIGGILLLLIFWLICSMPTNTHTFFYRTVINDMVTADISITHGYLNDIGNNENNVTKAKLKVDELCSQVDIKLGELEAEIKNDANPGFGPKAKEILREFADLLSVAKVEPLSYKSLSKQDRDKLCDAYRTKIYILRDSKAKNIMANILSPNKDNLKEVANIDKNLNITKQAIDEGKLDLNDADDITTVCDKLNEGYNAIKKNQDFVNFRSDKDKELYTAQNSVTKVSRMKSVISVWSDFLDGAYEDRGFIYWVIISILVDAGAFIFFTLAFKRQD